MTEKKQRKSPVPASPERITEGALNLKLEQRVKLRNDLTASIDKELADMEAKLKDARNLLNGIQ